MRSEPSIEVSCDNCVASEHVELTAIACNGYDERHVNDKLREAGWYADEQHEYCPDCAIALGLIDNDEVMMEATP